MKKYITTVLLAELAIVLYDFAAIADGYEVKRATVCTSIIVVAILVVVTTWIADHSDQSPSDES